MAPDFTAWQQPTLERYFTTPLRKARFSTRQPQMALCAELSSLHADHRHHFSSVFMTFQPWMLIYNTEINDDCCH
jgi:hypothetical protein